MIVYTVDLPYRITVGTLQSKNQPTLCSNKITYITNVIKKAGERNDDLGEAVKIRVHCLGDMVSAEAVYHSDRTLDTSTKRRPSG